MIKYRFAHDFATHVHVRYMLLTSFSQARAAYLLHVYYISDICRHTIGALGDYCISRDLDDAKCIVVTRVCVCVCLSVCPRPHAHTIARTRM